jgi:hypothetical protein
MRPRQRLLRLSVVALTGGLTLVACNLQSSSQTPAANGIKTIEASFSDSSPTLLEMVARQTPGENLGPEVERTNLIPEQFLANASRGESPGLARQNAVPPLPEQTPAPITSFEGLNQFDNRALYNGGGFLPPDTVGDVGRTQYFQAVNSAAMVFSKSTGARLLPQAVTLDSFWANVPGCTGGNGDPIVIYDHLANRWIISQMRFQTNGGTVSGPERDPDTNAPWIRPLAVPAGTESYECVAISQTGDATGAYYRYAFKIDNILLNDYPKMGVWPNGYYMSFNMFGRTPSGGSTFRGVRLAVAERSKMLSGNPNAKLILIDLDDNHFTVLPSDLDGPAPSAFKPHPFVMIGTRDFYGFPTDFIRMYFFKPNWANPLQSSFSGPLDLPINPLDSNLCNFSRNCIPQKGSPLKLDSIVSRLMLDANYRRRGDLDSIVVNATVDANGANLAGTAWYELRNLQDNGWYVNQQGIYNDGTKHTWMGSIAQNKLGEIALGFSTSSANDFPGIGYAMRYLWHPAGSLMTAAVLQAGTSFQRSSNPASTGQFRWGDYTAMTVDPVDDCTFWYTNEYYDASTEIQNPTFRSNVDYKTRIGSFRSPFCFK